MDFVFLVNQNCPVEIQQSVAQLEQGITEDQETEVFFPFSGQPLDRPCVSAMARYLASNVGPDASDGYKSQFYDTARTFAALSPNRQDTDFTIVRAELAEAFDRLIGDAGSDSLLLNSGLVGCLLAFQLDRRDAILTQANYRMPMDTLWQTLLFNEYALIFGDDEAEERLAAALSGATAPELRSIFTRMSTEVRRADPRLPAAAMERLVRPYVADSRATHEVDGDGPPVSDYARELLDLL